MPNIHNHSKKYIYTGKVYSRNESAKRDVEMLYGITCELADTNKKRKISMEKKRTLQKEAKEHCVAALNKLTMAQKELPMVSGLGDLEYCHKLHEDEFGDMQEDGTFPIAGETLTFTSPAPKQTTSSTGRGNRNAKDAKRKVNQNIVTPEFQKPTNGIAYRNPTSMVKALADVATPHRVRVRAKMIKDKLVEIKERQIRDHFSRFKNGLQLPRFFGSGRTRVVSVKNVMTDLLETKGSNNSDGITVSPDEIAESIQKCRTSKNPVSRSTIRRLINAIKQMFEGRVNVRMKTASRQSAEISIRPLPALIHVVAGTHFLVCEDGIGDSTINTASDGAKLLYNLVSKFHDDAALRVVKPQLLFSTDDSAIFASKSLNSNESNMWNICIQNRSAADKKNHSYFTTDRKNTNGGFKTGLTMRYTQTMNGTGHSAPIFLQLLHLNNRQLPTEKCPDGIVVLKFPGLCIGSSQDIRNDSDGYLVCVRQGTDESEIYNIYHRLVLIPHIQRLRKN